MYIVRSFRGPRLRCSRVAVPRAIQYKCRRLKSPTDPQIQDQNRNVVVDSVGNNHGFLSGWAFPADAIVVVLLEETCRSQAPKLGGGGGGCEAHQQQSRHVLSTGQDANS